MISFYLTTKSEISGCNLKDEAVNFMRPVDHSTHTEANIGVEAPQYGAFFKICCAHFVAVQVQTYVVQLFVLCTTLHCKFNCELPYLYSICLLFQDIC